MPPAARKAVENEQPAKGLGSGLRTLVVACRPTRWLKNVLVFSAPVSFGLGTDVPSMARATGVFAVFCLAGSGAYLFNDVRDRHADRLHPTKADRPVAAGTMSARAALSIGTGLVLAALAAAVAIGGLPLLATMVAYLVLGVAYSTVLREWPIADLAAVAGSTTLRAIAGAVVTGVPVSTWFVVVVSLMSLLLVVGRREAELALGAPHGARTTLRAYSAAYLAQLRTMVSGAMLVTYSLYALSFRVPPGFSFRALSIVPFALIVMRLNLLMEKEKAEEPEEYVLWDRPLQVFLGLAVLCLLAGIYL